MKIITLIITVLFCLYSCNSNKSKDLSGNGLINISIPEKNNADLSLSEFAESIQIFPLSQDMLIRDIDKLLVDDNNNLYIIDSKGDGIYKFDSKGKFVKQISQKGQGPGEYVSIEDFDIYKDQIYIRTDEKVMIFDLDGNYIKSFIGRFGNYISVSSDGIYNTWGAQSLAIYNMEDKQLEDIVTSHYPDDMLLYNHSFNLTKNKDIVYYEDCFNDTIYQAKGTNCFPAIYIDFGKKKLPENIKRDHKILSNPVINRYHRDVREFKISNEYISFFYLNEGPFLQSCIYDRLRKKTYTFQSIENDLNGFPCSGLVLCWKNEFMYSNTSSDSVLYTYEYCKNSSDPIEQQYARNILEICGGTVDEMDNDYIVVIKCK